MPSRLAAPLILSNGEWDLLPPRAADTTSLTYAEVAGDAKSYNADGSPSKPIVVLARFTNTLFSSDPPPSSQGMTGPLGWAPQPHDQLVVAVLRYGIDPVPPQGPVSMTGPLPTGLSSYRSVIWLLDPDTGKALYGTSYGGPLPQVPTSPGIAPSDTPTTGTGPGPASLDIAPGVLPSGTSLQGDEGAVTVVPPPAAQTASLTSSDAYTAYVKWEAGVPRYSVQPSFLYGLFTDTALADPSVSGTYVPHYEKVPAWAVIFPDVMAVPTGKAASTAVQTDVLDIVSDSTGKVIEELVGPLVVTAANN